MSKVVRLRPGTKIAKAAAITEAEWGEIRLNLSLTMWFELTPTGLVFCTTDPKGAEVGGEVPVRTMVVTTDPFSVYAATEPIDPDAPHGRVIRYRTARGTIEQRVIANSLIHEGGSAFVRLLADRGVTFDPVARGHLVRYVAMVKPKRRITSCSRTGWQRLPDGRAAFVLGDRIIGAEVVYQPGAATAGAVTGERGTLQAWKEHVALPACETPWWAFCTMAAFAAPLLRLLDEPSRGFHGVGGTSQGKTIGAACGASVYGRGTKNDDDSFIVTWNNTANALEGISEAHSDLPLCIDEIAEADSRTISKVIYLITDGAGRGRMRADATMKRRKRWRLIALSTGEHTLESRITADKKDRLAGGQTVRMLEIRLDSADTEMLRQVDPVTVRRLEAATGTYYGTAGPAFIEQLIAQRFHDPGSDAVLNLKATVQAIEDRLVGKATDSRLRRAARAFALVQAAGELAVAWGILPSEIDPAGIVMLAYATWRDGAGTQEVDDARMAARRLLDQVDAQINVAILPVGTVGEGPGNTVRDRIGWYRDDTLFLLRAPLGEALRGFPLLTFLERAEAEQVRAYFRGEGRNLQTKIPCLLNGQRGFRFSLRALRAWVDGGVLDGGAR